MQSHRDDSIGTRIQKWFNRASSTIVANLMVDISSDFDEFEVKKLSIQNNTPSEYTCIVLLQNDNGKEAVKQVKKQKSPKHAGQGRVLPAVVRGGGSIGFGDTKATLENRRLGEPTEPETFAIFNKATGCCNKIAYCCCCPCCIKVCSKMNDQLAILPSHSFVQLFHALHAQSVVLRYAAIARTKIFCSPTLV